MEIDIYFYLSVPVGGRDHVKNTRFAVIRPLFKIGISDVLPETGPRKPSACALLMLESRSRH